MTIPEVTIIDTPATQETDKFIESPFEAIADVQLVDPVYTEPTLNDIYNYLMNIDRRLTVMEAAAADLTKFIEGFSMPPMLAKMFGPKNKTDADR